MKMKRKLPQAYWLPLAVGAVFSLSAASVFAETQTVDTSRELNPAQEKANQANVNEGSFTKGILWESSFDKASDQTFEAERELKKTNYANACSAAKAPGISPQQASAAKAKCNQLEAELNSFGAEAESIRKTQNIFADVSRAADVAAIGAIGATGYAQLGKRKPTQADSLRSAASIQETAAYVSYAAGAADISMGAYAYAAQKSQLESMEEKLKRANAPASVRQKLLNAAEATKAAAYSHMMFGAGKVAVGYASSYLAKQNRKQADALSSISEATSTATGTAAAPSAAPPTGPASSIAYNNNMPVFSVSTGTLTSTSTAATTGVVATSGSSFASGSRSIASGSGGSLGSAVGGSGGSFGGGSGGGAAAAGDAPKGAEEAAEEAKKENGFEIAHSGGGSARYGGGGKSSGGAEKDELPNIGSMLAGALGGPASSAATGINPNQVFRDATDDENAGQGAEAGVSANSHSLFEVVRNRYFKLVEGGRVQGPGAVQVRN